VDELEILAETVEEQYCKFPKLIERNGKVKKRFIERPKLKLRRIQQRLVGLLGRIQPPDYLHSGFRGRSYISNALRHDCNSCAVKIDIKSFFPSAYAGYVFRCFCDTFKCSPDVAALIMKMTTVSGHLPTGGNSSTMFSFLAFKPMFDEIYALSKNHNLTMSCCVDDMTFSGESATSGFLNKVQLIVKRFGLRTHKRHSFEAGQPKIVTGVALTPRGVRLPNSRRRRLHEAMAAFERETNPQLKVKLGQQALGRVTEAAQVEKKFEALIPLMTKKLNVAKQSARWRE
jgi:hypothetical protein